MPDRSGGSQAPHTVKDNSESTTEAPSPSDRADSALAHYRPLEQGATDARLNDETYPDRRNEDTLVKNDSRVDSSLRQEAFNSLNALNNTAAPSLNLAESLGIRGWVHSDMALVEALRVLAEQERSRQESLRLENNKHVVQILHLASKLEIRASDLPLLFSANSEIASKIVSHALEELRVPLDVQESSQQQHFGSDSAHAPAFQSPKTPSRQPGYDPPGAITSSVRTVASSTQSGSPTTFLTPSNTLRSTPHGPYIQSSPFTHHQDLQQHQAPQPQQLSQPLQASSEQRVHPYYFERRDSPASQARGHRHALSALPTYEPISPSAYPPPSPTGRNMVQGFYPGQLIPPRLTQMAQLQPPPPNMTLPIHQQHSPQRLAHESPVGYALNPSIPVTGPPPMPIPIPAAPSSTSPTHGSVPSQAGSTFMHHGQQQQQQDQPRQPPHLRQMYHRATPSVESLGGPLPGLRGDRETAGVKRPLFSSGSASSIESSAGRPKTHRQSLSTGAELQIHQWKPKQLLRDNRWKITNPFARTKEKRTSEQTAGQPASHNGRSSNSSAASQSKTSAVQVARPEPTAQPLYSGSQSAAQAQSISSSHPNLSLTQRPPQAQPRPGYQQSPQHSPQQISQQAVHPQTSATVVAAQNNRRRSMTHARRRSAASLPAVVEPASSPDDVHRHDEGVAVLASLASEQWRRDSSSVRKPDQAKKEVETRNSSNAHLTRLLHSPKREE